MQRIFFYLSATQWHLFTKKLTQGDKLPPTPNAFKQHLLRAFVQAILMPNVMNGKLGWTWNGNEWTPIPINKQCSAFSNIRAHKVQLAILMRQSELYVLSPQDGIYWNVSRYPRKFLWEHRDRRFRWVVRWRRPRGLLLNVSCCFVNRLYNLKWFFTLHIKHILSNWWNLSLNLDKYICFWTLLWKWYLLTDVPCLCVDYNLFLL